MTIKKYYYTLGEAYAIAYNDSLTEFAPFNSPTLNKFITDLLSLTLTSYHVTLTESNVEKVWQDLVASRNEYPIFCIKKLYYEPNEPTQEEVRNNLLNWVYRFLNQLEHSYPYYNTLLVNYDAALSHLMEDIKATSKNKVKFNDTPQNPNTAGVYEGDDYITHFTSTEGENSSPLMSKMLRLKEIQDNFKSVLADWVNEMGRVFLTKED